jgi:hypothetical protein
LRHSLSDRVRRLITFDDIRGYHTYSTTAQQLLLMSVDAARRRAAQNAGLDRGAADIQSHGDGEMVRWPEEVTAVATLNDYVRELCSEMAALNGERPEGRPIQLRLAVVDGYSALEGGNLTGRGPVTAARLLDSRQCREALALAPQHPLAVITTDEIYQDVVADPYRQLRSENYVRVLVRHEGKDFTQTAWLTVPGCDAERLRGLSEDAAETPAEPGGTKGSSPTDPHPKSNPSSDSGYVQHNSPGSGGIVFASQGGVQNNTIEKGA